MISVTGASGYVGGRLVPRLLEAGHQVRVLARDPGRLQAGTGGRNFDESKPVVARNAVHHSTQYPSQVTIAVVKR